MPVVASEDIPSPFGTVAQVAAGARAPGIARAPAPRRGHGAVAPVGSLFVGRLLRRAAWFSAFALVGVVLAATVAVPECAPRIHRVTAGETMSTIARNEGISTSRLVELQSSDRLRRNPSLIRRGQIIRLPGSAELLVSSFSTPKALTSIWKAALFEVSQTFSPDGWRCVAALAGRTI